MATPSVDDILGPPPKATPTVDSILGPPPEAPAPNPAVDAAVNKSPMGRILDAFGQGAKDGWGSNPVGLSPEAEKALRDSGIFTDYQKNNGTIFRTFNEAIIRPAAATLDATMRAGNAFLSGAGAATGQEMNELGVTKAIGATEDSARRDFEGMAQITPMVLGTAQELGVVGPPRAAVGETAPRVLPPPEEPPPPGGGTGEAVAPPPEPQAVPLPETAAPKPQVMAAAAQGPHQIFSEPVDPVADKAGNINLDYISAPGDVKDVIRKTAQDNGGFMDARRGVISLAQTEDLADALGMTPESLNTRRIGTAFNAEEITAARNLLVQSATNVRDLAAKAAEGGEADVQAFVEAEAKHKAIQEQVAGITAEGGRALNAFKIMAGQAKEEGQFGEVLKSLGDTVDDAQARAKAIGELDTPNKVSAFLNSTRKPTFKDMFLEYWINGLLSGPATHTTYMGSNGLLALWKAGVETPVAATIGAARQAVSKTAVPRVMMGETGAQLHGFVQGALEGIPAGWRAIKSGVTEALPGEEQQRPLVPKIPGIAGQIVTVPSRVIAGIHTLSRSIGYRQQMNSLAYRQAAVEKLTGDDFATRMEQLKADPSDDMMKQATQEATAQTMMSRPDGLGARIEAVANHNVFTKMIAPFVRVGVNIVDQGLVQRTPLGVLSSDVRDTLMGKNGAAARDIQIARMGVGTALGAAVIGLAAQGLITGGGPSDPKAMAVWRLEGKQPYSVRIGDMWYGYHRLGSLGQIIGVSADMYEIGHMLDNDQKDNIAATVMGAVSKNLVDETWMRGPADLIQAVTDPDRYGAYYVRNQLATLTPFSVGMGQLARATDPFVRNPGADTSMANAWGIIDTVKSKIPYLSETVRPKYDIWGQPIANQGAAGVDGLSAIYESRVNNDPVNREMNDLGIFPGPVEKKIRGAQLTPDEHDEYQMTAGRLAKMQLDTMVNAPGWEYQPDWARKEAIENAIKGSRMAAEGLMQMRHPELIQEGVKNRVQQISGVEK